MEPGPAGDLMLCLVEDELPNQFFFNTKYFQIYHKAGKVKKKELPGYHYFTKIQNFMEDHTERGELFMEYRIGLCTKKGLYDLCPFCKDLALESLPNPSPRPYPDYSALTKYKYLSLSSTPSENRTTDDFLPRANLNALFKNYGVSSSDDTAIQEFSDKYMYIVEKEHVISYVKHLDLLELKKDKRAEKRNVAKKKYNECDTKN
jgi:hypothetical protein